MHTKCKQKKDRYAVGLFFFGRPFLFLIGETVKTGALSFGPTGFATLDISETVCIGAEKMRQSSKR